MHARTLARTRAQVTGVLFLDNNLDDEMAIPMLVYRRIAAHTTIPTTAERSLSSPC
jgi:hypothetical protein